MTAYDFLCPYPQHLTASGEAFRRPEAVRLLAPPGTAATTKQLARDLRRIAGVAVDGKAAYPVRLELVAGSARPEGYTLRFAPDGAVLRAADQAGLFYATQTLLQMLALSGSAPLPAVDIEDFPDLRLRSFMVDPGRAPYTMPLLKRIVRILARLKMNLLHLHLVDDELGSLRFETLPLGSENPTALSLTELKELIAYARRHHVTVMPEIECWGHAGYAIYHYPHLYGAPGMWGGMSFGIGEETFALIARMFDELVPVLEEDCLVHVGLDEARWALLKSVPAERHGDYSPELLVGRIHELLMAAGRKHGRNITMHLWADHGGRPLPPALADRVVVEPWNYAERDEEQILAKLQQYGGAGKPRFMMGAGMSSAHLRGHFGATRIWCQQGRVHANVAGVTICTWCGNDLANYLLGLYGGADYAWSADTPVKQSKKTDPVREILEGEVHRRMRHWQQRFSDADPEAINRERGPEVFAGRYCWGRRAGQAVAPTADARTPEELAAAAEL